MLLARFLSKMFYELLKEYIEKNKKLPVRSTKYKDIKIKMIEPVNDPAETSYL